MNKGSPTSQMRLTGVTIFLMAETILAVDKPKPQTQERVNLMEEKHPMEVARKLFPLIDLTKPGLAQVAKFYNDGKYAEALDAYLDRFLLRVSRLHMGPHPSFWLWGHTNPHKLLKGTVGTAQYGEFSQYTVYNIGLPGNVNWHKIPEDGYDTVLRDLPTMHWVSTLVPAYQKSKDPAYLRAWVGYWADFATNWLADHQRILRDPAYKDRVNGTIPWASSSRLYHAWRTENFFSYLSEAMAVSPAEAKKNVDSEQLARILIHFATFDIPQGIFRMNQGMGCPNQTVLCATAVLMAATNMEDFKQADEWADAGLKRMKEFIAGPGALADGSDMEQSFNYNGSLVAAVDRFIVLLKNPPFENDPPACVEDFLRARDYRLRFLATLPMPDGREPSIGCGSNWHYSRGRAVKRYKKPAGRAADPQDRINNHLLGDGSLPVPTFTSVYYPIGGYVLMRDGWRPTSHYAFMKTSRAGHGHMREGGNGMVISAFGKYLLVNSSDMAYSKRGNYSKYFYGTISQNSICVDGLSQNLGRATKAYTEPIPARWLTSDNFDFAEGSFKGSYSGWNFKTNRDEASHKVTDVRHDRQVIFLRKLGLFVVTDILFTKGTHDYTQSSNLSPDFANDDVLVNDNAGAVRTKKSGQANIGLYYFAPQKPSLKKYYGVATKELTLGWVAKEKSPGVFTPAADIHADWKGQGDQVLATFVEPTREVASNIKKIADLTKDGVVGLGLELKDGQTVTYFASLKAANLKAGVIAARGRVLLVTTDTAGDIRGMVLNCSSISPIGKPMRAAHNSFEFQLVNGKVKVVAPIEVPKTFTWVKARNGMTPAYK